MFKLQVFIAFTGFLLSLPLATSATTQSRELLVSDQDMHPISLHDIPLVCTDETFEVYMVQARGHFFLGVIPTAISTCLPLVVNAGLTSRDADGTLVEPSVRQLQTIGPLLVDFVRQEGTFLGMKPLPVIHEAFQRSVAVTTTTGVQDHAGLMEANNCSFLLVSLLHHLNVMITPEIRMFLIEGLTRSTPRVLDTMMAEYLEAREPATGGLRRRMLRTLTDSSNTTEDNFVEEIVDHDIETCRVGASP